MSKEPEPRAPRPAPRRVIDWPRAARLFDQGLTVAEVAERIGCSRSALTRRRRTDPRFQNRTEPPVEVAPEEDAADLRPSLQRVVERELRSGGLRVGLWLASRLKLVTPPDENTPEEELRQMLSALSPEELREFQSLQDQP
ncbi:MAG TPA: helix-turn-helix domain-containing protein [Geminicoccaceae bacterium]|nr:helix-turn-helix domain-containing protein [Geminicoccaceae bacterium]